MSEFGRWLRAEIARKGMKQADFARKVGASTGAVSDWVNGRRIPTTASVDRIADALRVSVDDVLTHSGHRPHLPRERIDELHARFDHRLIQMDKRDLDTLERMIDEVWLRGSTMRRRSLQPPEEAPSLEEKTRPPHEAP